VGSGYRWERSATGLRFEACCGGELEVPIWIVLDNHNIVFTTESIDLFTAFNGKGAACWVLANAAIEVSNIGR
jgi:hypothetical protein